ncbi:hypothetical protein LSH36_979g02020 [Paralvinella palmiformis]|uniref:Uncharacterized protein n=1 Tax=Paralvinella palmiformis TaxID=53620 RepID=A0AAD9IXA3_9ANNE|nr:hypothetical protein LSH36_979g02020 [Paralvinella palmiformis]
MARKSVLQGRQFKYIKGGMYTLNFFVWKSCFCEYLRTPGAIEEVFQRTEVWKLNVEGPKADEDVIVLGLALGSVGIWIRMDFNTDKYRKVLNPVFRLCEEEDHEFEFTISVHMDSISYFLIFVGVSIMATGCVGMCGTKREKATLMAMFFLLLFIIFGILLTAGIKAMVKKDTPCEKAIKDFFSAIEDNMIMTLVVSFSIGIFTLLGMGMSTYLFFALRKAK